MQTNSQTQASYRQALKLSGNEFAFLDKILCDCPDLITIHDAITNHIIYSNHANFWKDLFDPDEVYKMQDEERVAAMIDDDYIEKANAFLKMRRMLEDDDSIEVELKMKHGIWIRVESKVFKRDSNGNPSQIVSFSTNITDVKNAEQEVLRLKDEVAQRERKKAEEALHQSEERITKLISLMPAAVYTCDAEGHITYFNRRAVEMWGREPQLGDEHEKFCGSFRMWKPDGTLLMHEHCPMADAVREGKEGRNLEVIIEQPSGNRLVAIVNIDPLFDLKGKIIGAINVFVDVTEQRRAQEALRDAQNAYRSELEKEVRDRTVELRESKDELEREHHFLEQVTDKAPLLIYVYDLKENRFTFINKQVEIFISRDQDYVYAMGPHLFQAILHPDDVGTRATYMEKLSSLNQYDVREMDFRIWNGEEFRWFRSRDSIFIQDKGRVKQVIGIAEDITFEKRFNEKLNDDQGSSALN